MAEIKCLTSIDLENYFHFKKSCYFSFNGTEIFLEQYTYKTTKYYLLSPQCMVLELWESNK